jgi:hypothetical protein
MKPSEGLGVGVPKPTGFWRLANQKQPPKARKNPPGFWEHTLGGQECTFQWLKVYTLNPLRGTFPTVYTLSTCWELHSSWECASWQSIHSWWPRGTLLHVEVCTLNGQGCSIGCWGYTLSTPKSLYSWPLRVCSHLPGGILLAVGGFFWFTNPSNPVGLGTPTPNPSRGSFF